MFETNEDLLFSKGRQLTKGLPVMCRGQEQMAVVPSLTRQLALTPHTPAQGSMHLELMQDGLLLGQSPWLRHSARQDV